MGTLGEEICMFYCCRRY